jgi:rhodanese-related sulfurtransferase
VKDRYQGSFITFLLLFGFVCGARAQVPPDSVPEGKKTALGKYILSARAYEKWKANPQGIKILDVRTRGEYVYVGHATMACNIPFRELSGRWDPEKNRYPMPLNPGFVEAVRQQFSPEDTILIMCRSGGRSASACNMLAEHGFRNAYSIIDGFEGDKVTDPASYYYGKRAKNGWKNSGTPWTYDLDRKLIYKK